MIGFLIAGAVGFVIGAAFVAGVVLAIVSKWGEDL